jgi:hypothetical protein
MFIKINPVHRLLHRLVMGDVVDVSEVHAASIFLVEVCRLVSSCVCTAFCFDKIGKSVYMCLYDSDALAGHYLRAGFFHEVENISLSSQEIHASIYPYLFALQKK